MIVKNSSVDTSVMGGASKVNFWRRKDVVNIVGPNSTTLWVTLDCFLDREDITSIYLLFVSFLISFSVLIINGDKRRFVEIFMGMHICVSSISII